MTPIDTFQTRRLVAERLRAEDYGPLCRLHKDVRVMATLGGVRSDAETQRGLHEHLDHWERHGYGLWIFRDRASGAFVGRGGLRRVEVGGCAEVELAYALVAESWGTGLGTEMAIGSLAVAFEQLDLVSVVAFTLPTNRGSQRVMEKAGLSFERDIIWAALPHVLYRITREQWVGRRQPCGSS